MKLCYYRCSTSICSTLIILLAILNNGSISFRVPSLSWFHRTAAPHRLKFTCYTAAVCQPLNELPQSASTILLPNALELNTAIINLFGSEKNPLRRDVQSLLFANLQRMSAVNVVTLMHRSSKIDKDVRTFLNDSVILALLDPSLHDPLDAMGICNCLYGLKNFDDKHQFTTQVIIRLIAQIERLPPGSRVTVLGISNSLYGMKSFSWQGSHSIRLLQALQTWIIRSYSSINPVLYFTPQTLSNSFFGLQSLPSSLPLKTWFMQLLSQSMDHLQFSLDAFSVSNILLGLKETDTRYTPAREILEKIVSKCQAQPEILYDLDGRKLSMSLWGLQGMTSEQREVVDLLTVFNDRIEEIMLSRNRTRIEAIKFQSTEEVGLLLGGMRGLSSDSSEVRRFLFNVRRLMQMPSATSPRLKKALRKEGKYWIFVKREEKFLASAFHGLQRLDDRHAEVRGVVRELVQALVMDLRSGGGGGRGAEDKKKANAWSFGSVSTALYGLQSMSSSNSSEAANAVKLLSFLFPKNDSSDYYYHRRHAGSAQEIGMALYGLKSMTMTSVPDLPRVLKALTAKVREVKDKDRFGLREVSMSVYGLRYLDIGYPAVREALEALTAVLALHNRDHSNRNKGKNSSRSSRTSIIDKGSVVTMLLGIENMGIYRTKVVRKFIKQLTPLIDRCQDSFLPSELAVMLRSLKNVGCDNDVNKLRSLQRQLSSDESLVEERLEAMSMTWNNSANTKNRRLFVVPLTIQPFLKAIATKLKQREAPLTASMVCSALYGLQGFTADDWTILSIIQSLSDDLAISQDRLSDQDIGMGLYGLQNMTASSYQVQRLLTHFTAAIDRSPVTIMSAQSIGNSFFGLQSMNSNVEEVGLLLGSLANKLESVCNDPSFAANPNYEMSCPQLGRMFFGLRNKFLNEEDDDESENNPQTAIALRRILRSMTTLSKRSKADLTAHSLANAFWGLQGFSTSYEEVRQALASLAHKLVLSSHPFTGLDYGMILYALRKMDSGLPEVRVVYGTLVYRMRKSPTTLQLQEMSMMVMGILRTTEWIREDFIKVLSSSNDVAVPLLAASTHLQEEREEEENKGDEQK